MGDVSLVFVKVAEISEVPAGKMKKITLEGKDVLIVNLNGTYYAIGNKCPHRGGDLSKGTLDGTQITCPRHKAKFDITSGKVISGPKLPIVRPTINDEPLYDVKVEGNDIFIKTS